MNVAFQVTRRQKANIERCELRSELLCGLPTFSWQL